MPTRIEDLLDLDSLLTREDIELRQTVRRFGEQRLRPRIADWLEAGEVPVRELAADLGKLGVPGMHLKGYGCGGSTATAYGCYPRGSSRIAQRWWEMKDPAAQYIW
jgi:glutaryl-CoA dehydrogenase